MKYYSYNKSRGNYLIGIVCLFASLIFFSYSAYVLPYLIFKWQYNLPNMILSWVSVMKNDYHFSDFATSCIVFFSLFTPGLILIIIADVISNRLESDLVPKEPEPEENLYIESHQMSDGVRLTLKIIGLLLLVFISIRILEWAISK